MVTKINRLDTALISGFTPNRIFENINIGKVFAPGPETKLATIKSSKLSIKLSNQPLANAGRNRGKVMRQNMVKALAPKSAAAASNSC